MRITDIPGTGIHALRDQKLLPVIGSGPADARPNLAPFRRSGLTNVALLNNLGGASVLEMQVLLPAPDFVIARKQKHYWQVQERIFDYRGQYRKAY